jgi:hypothetical protein
MSGEEVLTVGQTARLALENDLCVVPAAYDGGKRPHPGGSAWQEFTTRLPTSEELSRWFGQGSRYCGLGVVCGAVSGGLEMLEFEGRAVEADLFDEFDLATKAAGLSDVWNRIVSGYCERTPSGGFHILYRCERVDGNLKLARRPSTENERAVDPNDKVKVLIETRGEGGFTIIAPSNGTTHPTGRAWTLLTGGITTIATITPEERTELLVLARSFDRMPVVEHRVPAGVEHHDHHDGDRPGDVYNRTATWHDVLGPHGWVEVYQHGEVTAWRRPGKTFGVSATTNVHGTDLLKVFSTSTEFDTDTTYSKFAAYAVLHHGGDYQAAARQLRQNGDGRPADRSTGSASGAPAVTAAEAVPHQSDEVLLPDEFWDARPELAHIRQAARARLIAPDGLLGAVLARVCVWIDWRLGLPPIVGRRGSLNLSVALAGRSGAGKGSVTDESRELVGYPTVSSDHRIGEAPAGSGEGIVKKFFTQVPDPSSTARRAPMIQVRNREALLIRVDEAEMLQALHERSGQTTEAVLRQAFSGEALGNSYVNDGGARQLEEHTYRLALLMSVQPTVAKFLFDAEAGGTPQRLLWLAAENDPGAPDRPPEHPGPLQLHLPTFQDVQHRAVTDGRGYKHVLVDVHPSIVEQLQQDRRGDLRGETIPDPLDTHTGLVRLKVAALLAMLDRGRIDINAEDWRLAGIVTDTSTAVREWMRGLLAQVERRANVARHENAAERASIVEKAKVAAGGEIVRVARIVARHVRKQHDKPCTERCVGHAINSRDRHDKSAAVAHAVAQDWIRENDGIFTPGESSPA